MTSSPMRPSRQYNLHCDKYVRSQTCSCTNVSFEIEILSGQLRDLQVGSPPLQVGLQV